MVIDDKPIVYSIPTRMISCRYLRIHVTNVINPENLILKTSGLIVNEIYGENSKSDLTVLCKI